MGESRRTPFFQNASTPERAGEGQVVANTKTRFAGLSREPSDGLEPSTPSLPSIFGGGQAKPVATVYGLARQF